MPFLATVITHVYMHAQDTGTLTHPPSSRTGSCAGLASSTSRSSCVASYMGAGGGEVRARARVSLGGL